MALTVKALIHNRTFGYTIVELMVTMVITTVLAVTLGTFFVKLLTLQERERNEAYIREKLVDICATLADYASVGSSVNVIGEREFTLTYRHEVGGVSLETGRVSHVVQLWTSHQTDQKHTTLNLDIDAQEATNIVRKFSRNLRGEDTPLLPFKGLKMGDDRVNLYCQVFPLLKMTQEKAPVWYLQVVAEYDIRNAQGDVVTTNVTAGRMVRLWNRE